MMFKKKATEFIKERAYRLGFTEVGISRVERLNGAAVFLKKWLMEGNHGKMAYMENHFEKRVNPQQLVPGAKSVISFLYNYFTEEEQVDYQAPLISKYAYGKDYHFVIKKKLGVLFESLKEEFGDIQGRYFVDSAPVLEREWARKSGLGWIGKNTMLINPKAGSYFFLSELIIDLELEYDLPIINHCRNCRKCIDACPTNAIAEEGFSINASKCISYLTIELKDENIPTEFVSKLENRMFGCDICQEVCPWNKFSTQNNEPAFEPHPDLLNKTKKEWENLTESEFKKIFKNSPVKRTKFKKFSNNIDAALKNQK